MLIGLYLRANFRVFVNMSCEGALARLAGQSQEQSDNLENTRRIINEHEMSLWCLIALTHDLGYPVEKTDNANEVMTHMIGNFGHLEQQHYRYSFTVAHQPVIGELLEILSSAIMWSGAGWTFARHAGRRLDYAKSFERLDHGIMSAYLLVKYLDFICETLAVSGSRGLYGISHDAAAKAAMVITLLEAVSAHTNDNRYWSELGDMGALLLLCDELDEFSRYSHSVETGEWKPLKCRTELRLGPGSIRLKYTFEQQERAEHIESFFKRKVEKLWNRFDVGSGTINRLCIVCRDLRKARPIEFTYDKKHFELPGGIVKRGKRRKSSDIQGFLDGTVDL